MTTEQERDQWQQTCEALLHDIKNLTVCQCEGCDGTLEGEAFCIHCLRKAQVERDQLQQTCAELREEIERLKECAL